MLKIKPTTFVRAAAIATLAVGVLGCETAPTTPQERNELSTATLHQANRMFQDYPEVTNQINNAYAYAIFPDIGNGAVVVGAAHGHGEVFQGQKFLGYAELDQLNVGPQVGGQAYTELLLFKTKEAFDNFANNRFTFSASASAVILKSGTSGAAKWDDDVAVYQRSQNGAFVGASIGGQRFTFKAEIQ